MKSVRLQLLVTLLAAATILGVLAIRGLPPTATLLYAVRTCDADGTRRSLAWGGDANYRIAREWSVWADEDHVNEAQRNRMRQGQSWGQRYEAHHATMLHLAAHMSDKAIIRLLLDFGADMEGRDYFEMTPLHYAARTWWEDQGAVELLLARGASIDAGDFLGRTPLAHAARAGNMAVVELLLAHGANVHPRDNMGETPLHLTKDNDIAELLITNGADVNAKDNDGEAPLYRAKDKNIAELLIAKGADVNARDDIGRTPLHEIVWSGKNAIDLGKYRDPYFVAKAPYRAEDRDIAGLLIAKGADVNAKSYDGRTPLVIAINEGHYDVADLLRRHGARE